MKNSKIGRIIRLLAGLYWVSLIIRQHTRTQELHLFAALMLVALVASRCWPIIQERSGIRGRSTDARLQSGLLREMPEAQDASIEDTNL